MIQFFFTNISNGAERSRNGKDIPLLQDASDMKHEKRWILFITCQAGINQGYLPSVA